jgi:tetratricopeptide (TPR) repeat protein
MTTAIIIVILILVLSVILFFVIKQFSYVDHSDSDIYSEEGSITDFNSLKQESKDSMVEEITLTNSRIESIKARLTILFGQIYRGFTSRISKFSKLVDVYKQGKANSIKKREQEIQDAIKKDQEYLESQSPDSDSISYYNADTSKFEAEDGTVMSSKNEKNNSKATDFVAKLLSEVDAVTDLTTQDTDVSDTYYYEYMEKRYIDRIVANSKDVEAYKKLGALYVDIKNYKDALESFRYVLKIKPNDTTAIRRVKELSSRLGK